MPCSSTPPPPPPHSRTCRPLSHLRRPFNRFVPARNPQQQLSQPPVPAVATAFERPLQPLSPSSSRQPPPGPGPVARASTRTSRGGGECQLVAKISIFPSVSAVSRFVQRELWGTISDLRKNGKWEREKWVFRPILLPFWSQFPQPHPAFTLHNPHPVCCTRNFPISPCISPISPPFPPHFPPFPPHFPPLPPISPHFRHFFILQNPGLVSLVVVSTDACKSPLLGVGDQEAGWNDVPPGSTAMGFLWQAFFRGRVAVLSFPHEVGG